jgi:hypothetical protein
MQDSFNLFCFSTEVLYTCLDTLATLYMYTFHLNILSLFCIRNLFKGLIRLMSKIINIEYNTRIVCFLNMDELGRFNVGHLQVVASKRPMV